MSRRKKENPITSRISISIDINTLEEWRKYSKQLNISLSSFIRESVNKILIEREKDEKNRI